MSCYYLQQPHPLGYWCRRERNRGWSTWKRGCTAAKGIFTPVLSKATNLRITKEFQLLTTLLASNFSICISKPISPAKQFGSARCACRSRKKRTPEWSHMPIENIPSASNCISALNCFPSVYGEKLKIHVLKRKRS